MREPKRPTGVMCYCCGHESFKNGGKVMCDYCFLRRLQDSKPPSASTERSRNAARELLSFLDIRFPRGVTFSNNLEQTIAICIEQNMKY